MHYVLDGEACLRSGSPPARSTTTSTSPVTYPKMMTNISPPPPSSASSASSPLSDTHLEYHAANLRPPDLHRDLNPADMPDYHQSDGSVEHNPATSTTSTQQPPQSSPSSSPGVPEDVPALLWYLFSRLCWVSFAQVAVSEHHHVSRVLTSGKSELIWSG